MDANIRRPLPGPVARLALKSESLQEVAQFEAVAQNLRNHEQGAFGSTAAIWGRPGERRVLALSKRLMQPPHCQLVEVKLPPLKMSESPRLTASDPFSS